MISIHPGLRASLAISSYQYDDVFWPKRPSWSTINIVVSKLFIWGQPTFEISCQCQSQRHTTLIQFSVHIGPSCHEHNGLSRVTSRSVEYRVNVLSPVDVACNFILVLLACRPQSRRLEYLEKFRGDSIGQKPLDQIQRIARFCLLFHILCLPFPRHCLNFVFVRIEDILFAPSKIGMHLAREKSVLGDVCLSRIFVEWQQK